MQDKHLHHRSALAGAVRPPSLLKVYRFWQANGTACTVKPFYGGVTLKERLRPLGSPPDERWLVALRASLTDALTINCAER